MVRDVPAKGRDRCGVAEADHVGIDCIGAAKQRLTGGHAALCPGRGWMYIPTKKDTLCGNQTPSNARRGAASGDSQLRRG